MKKYFAVAAGFLVAVLLSGCCSLCSSGNTSVAGSWQMYGLGNDGKLTSVPVEMAFGTDGTLTTVIEQKDIRKSRWKAEGKYIIIYQKNQPLVRLERKGNDQLTFEWRGDKYKNNPLKLIIKRK